MSDPYDPDEESRLDRRVLAGIVFLTLGASVALFGLPLLRGAGFTFEAAFWSIAAVELAAAFGIAWLVFHLTRD